MVGYFTLVMDIMLRRPLTRQLTNCCHCVQIGAFKVVSEAGIASGVRRIEAVVGPAAVEYLNEIDSIVQKLASQFKVKLEELPARVAGACAGIHSTHSMHSIAATL